MNEPCIYNRNASPARHVEAAILRINSELYRYAFKPNLKRMKPIYLLFAATFTFASCSQSSNATEKTEPLTAEQTKNGTENGIKTIRTAEAKTLLAQQKDLIILDVRTPQEYAGGHLKNAVLLNKYDPDFEAKLKALDKEKTYLVYCAVGGRSGQTANMMQQMGFKYVYDATEGFNPLKDAGAAVE